MKITLLTRARLFYRTEDFMIGMTLLLGIIIPPSIILAACHADVIDQFFYRLLKSIWG